MKVNFIGILLANVLANLMQVHSIRLESAALCFTVCAGVALYAINTAPAYHTRMYTGAFYALLAAVVVAYFSLTTGVYLSVIASTLLALWATILHYTLSVRALRNLNDNTPHA
jgi:hypothetical protein